MDKMFVGREWDKTPPRPLPGVHILYFKDDGKLYSLGTDGVETEVGAGGGSSHAAVTLGVGSNVALALSGQQLTLTLPALANHVHAGIAGDGGTFDATNLTSGAATDDYVLTADGSGGAAWEAVAAPHAAVTLGVGNDAALALSGQELTLTLPALGDHDHSGNAGDGGTFDAAGLTSGAGGDGEVLTADGSGGAAWEAIPAGGAHVILSATHTDTTPAAAVRGDIITAQGESPVWAALAKGALGDVLTMGAAEPGWAAPAGGVAHDFLSATHSDTTASAVVRGGIIVADATPKWVQLAKGAQYRVLMMGADDPAWTALLASHLPAHAHNAAGEGGDYAWADITGFAVPSNTVKLATVQGSATTVLRSDATLALDQSISPTWTGVHLFASGNDPPVTLEIQLSDDPKNVLYTPLTIRSHTEIAMGDGFGSGIQFEVEDDAHVHNEAGALGCVRAGSDTVYDMIFQLYDGAGAEVEKVRLDHHGNVFIGHTATINTYDRLAIFSSNNYANLAVNVYSDTASHFPIISFQHSHSDTLGTLVETIDTEILGVVGFNGVRATTPAFTSAAQIRAVQVGAAGANQVAADLTFSTATAAGALAEAVRITSDKKVGIGTPTVPHGTIGGALLALEGVNSNLAGGPHVQFTTATDDYPLIQILPWAHDNMFITFDGYYNGAWRSSDAGSNFQIEKLADKLSFKYESGVNAGDAATYTPGIVLAASGYVGIDTTTPLANLHLTGQFLHDANVRYAVFKLTGLADNVATNFFTVTTTNEASNDGGGWVAFIEGIAGNDGTATSAEQAVMGFSRVCVRAMKDGSGANGTVLASESTARATTNSATKDINTVTVTMVETSEFVTTIQIAVDQIGTSVTTTCATVSVKLLWMGFTTPPVMAQA